MHSPPTATAGCVTSPKVPQMSREARGRMLASPGHAVLKEEASNCQQCCVGCSHQSLKSLRGWLRKRPAKRVEGGQAGRAGGGPAPAAGRRREDCVEQGDGAARQPQDPCLPATASPDGLPGEPVGCARPGCPSPGKAQLLLAFRCPTACPAAAPRFQLVFIQVPAFPCTLPTSFPPQFFPSLPPVALFSFNVFPIYFFLPS